MGRPEHGFDIDRVAGYGDRDRERLLNDAGIIRNRLKVDAAIHNAQVIRGLRASHGSFAQWLDAQVVDDNGRRRDKAAWVKLNGSLSSWQGYNAKLADKSAQEGKSGEAPASRLLDGSVEPPFLIGTACGSCHASAATPSGTKASSSFLGAQS